VVDQALSVKWPELGIFDVFKRRAVTLPNSSIPVESFPVTGDEHGRQSFGRLYSPGSKVDWRSDAGRLDTNGIVGIAVNFYQTNWHQAHVQVGRGVGVDFVADPGHPLVQSLLEPNPWYDGEVLWDGSIVSSLVSGNCYWAVLRRNGGDPAFVYLPHIYVSPMGSSGNALVGGYQYRIPNAGKILELKPEEVLHFRRGMTLEDTKIGLSPLANLIREVATDNLASTFDASLLKNFGAAGLLLAVKDMSAEPTPEQVEDFRANFRAAFSGDGAGKAAMLGIPVEKISQSMTPEEMALDKLRSVPVSRILSALGLNDIALGLPSASKTYDNYGEAMMAAWNIGILPTMDRFSKKLTTFARGWYGDQSLVVRFDTSEIDALQDDMVKLSERWSKLYVSGVCKRSEAKLALDLPVDDTEDDVYIGEANLGIGGASKALAKLAGQASRSRRRKLEEEGNPDADSSP